MVQSCIPSTIATHPQALDSGTCSHPFSNYIYHEKVSSLYKVFLAAVTLDVELFRFFEAVTHLPWREAMKTEIEALE